MRYERGDLAQLFAGARRIVVAKGRTSITFELDVDAALPDAAIDLAIGPTGKLRAPALRSGATWLVGFHADAWEGELGGA